MAQVVIADAARGAAVCLEEIFAPFGGIERVIPRNGGRVYLKPNAVHFTPYAYTDIRVMEAVLAYLKDHGYSRLSVMESSTGGNFTRLVFQKIGYTALCRRYGAEAVYLDEGPTREVDLNDGSRIHVSRRLHDQIIRRGDNFYLGIPKLKTHSMAVVSLGVKNQQAFPVAGDRMGAHSHETLHRRLAALYALTRPDFCIVEGITATAHGHIPARAFAKDLVLETNVLVGGNDTLAVDVVAAKMLGYAIDEVRHLAICAEMGLGQGDLGRIEVRGVPLERFSSRVPHTLLRRFNPDVRLVIGRQKACVEGCRGNTEAIQEMLYNDFAGKGGWTLLYGSGFQETDLQGLPGDILVVGPCACSEVGAKLEGMYPDRTIYRIEEHNDLMSNTRYQSKLAGVLPIQLVPGNPLGAALTLLAAKLHGLNARVPPILG